MKKSIIPLCLLGAISLVASCGSKNDSTSTIEKERDSLLTVNSQQQMILDNMTSTMAEISMSLDSIAIQEQMIIRGVDELGNPLKKKNININGKSPKILSEAPKDSYRLDKSGNSSVLKINDSEKFWSANNKILVIQIK